MMKDRIVLKAVKGKCGDCFFAESGQCVPMPCDKGMIYIEDTEQGWISVEDRLPENGQEVLIINTFNLPHIEFARYLHSKKKRIKDFWVSARTSLIYGGVTTHWTPILSLPEPPEAKTQEPKPVCPECIEKEGN